MKLINYFITIILLTFSCKSEKKISRPNTKLTKIEKLTNDDIIKLISNINEVKFEIQKIKKNREREGLIIIWRSAELKKDSCCWVKVGEDNGDAFATHFNFFVNVVNKEIKYLDVISGNKISLDEWRKIKSRKNKTASNSTYATTGETTRTC